MPSAEIAPVTDREPWDRQHGESAQAFAAFAHYRDSGPTRSLLQTAQHLRDTMPQRKGKVESIRTQISQWSSKWSWQTRVEAFEISEDRRRRVERQAMQRQMEERHLAGSNIALVASLLRMQGGKDARGNDIAALRPDQIEDWSEATTVLEKAVRIGRLTLGMPTDLMKSMDSWTTQDVMRLTRAVIDTMLPFIADENQHEAVTRVQDVFVGWGRR